VSDRAEFGASEISFAVSSFYCGDRGWLPPARLIPPINSSECKAIKGQKTKQPCAIAMQGGRPFGKPLRGRHTSAILIQINAFLSCRFKVAEIIKRGIRFQEMNCVGEAA
jgi:hypothetical protein